eukprot:1155219-Pelagomonas_calceolata.AAC.1
MSWERTLPTSIPTSGKGDTIAQKSRESPPPPPSPPLSQSYRTESANGDLKGYWKQLAPGPGRSRPKPQPSKLFFIPSMRNFLQAAFTTAGRG